MAAALEKFEKKSPAIMDRLETLSIKESSNDALQFGIGVYA